MWWRMEVVICYKNGLIILPVDDWKKLEQLLESLKMINPKHENIKLIVKKKNRISNLNLRSKVQLTLLNTYNATVLRHINNLIII